jgi:hypothetical protein
MQLTDARMATGINKTDIMYLLLFIELLRMFFVIFAKIVKVR